MSSYEVIKKYVPSRRRGVSEPKAAEPVKEIGKRKRDVSDDESENEYDPEPKRAKNDDKELKDLVKEHQKEEVK
jgi:ribosomal protein L14E/L6E/L27E